jgi:thioredoxin 1
MTTESPRVLELTEQNFAASIDDHPFAVIDFWAPWCAPCRAFAPTFAAAAAKHPDVRFAKVNTEEQAALAAHFNIRSIPTLMIFRSNIIVFAEAGALSASALDQVLNGARELDMDQVRRDVEAQAAEAAKTAPQDA